MRGYHTNLAVPEKAVLPETARATSRSQPHRSTRQRPRIDRTDAVAEALGLHRSAVSLARGTRSRVKLLDLDATDQDVRAALAALPEEPA